MRMNRSYVDDICRVDLRKLDEVQRKPAVLGVIVERGYGYRRPDGVSVIPVGALGP